MRGTTSASCTVKRPSRVRFSVSDTFRSGLVGSPPSSRKRPSVYCPFGSQMNPLLGEIVESSIAWLNRVDLVPSETGLARFRDGHIPHLLCHARPAAGADELLWSCKLLCWGVALDDLIDHRLCQEPPQHTVALMRRCTSVLAVDGVALVDELRSPPLLHSPFVSSLHELWTEIVPHTPADWRARFAHHLEGYLLSQASEVENRALKRVPDLESYLVLRRHTGMEPAPLDLVEYDEGLFLPSSIASSPEMRTMRHAAEDYVDWINDLYSWNKERLVEDPHNLVTVLQHQEGCDLQEAVGRSCRMIASAARIALEMGERLPVLFPAHARGVERYTISVQDWLGGYCHWYGITRRYDVPTLETAGEHLSHLIRPHLVIDATDAMARSASLTGRR